MLNIIFEIISFMLLAENYDHDLLSKDKNFRQNECNRKMSSIFVTRVGLKFGKTVVITGLKGNYSQSVNSQKLVYYVLSRKT